MPRSKSSPKKGVTFELKKLTILENQISKVLESVGKYAKISSILSKLDLSFLTRDLEDGSKFGTDCIVKMHLLRRVKGIRRFPALLKYLRVHEEEALQLGFFKDGNSVLQLPAKRTFNEFFQKKINKEMYEFFERVTEKILALATQRNVILDLDLIRKEPKKEKKNHTKEFREAVKLVKRLVYPQIDLKIKHNGKFTTKDLLDVLVHVAQTHDFANNGSATFQALYPDRKAPSGDLMMYHFNKISSLDQVKDMFEKVLDVILSFAKKEYNILKRRKLDIAYDIHKIPYYGKPIDYIRSSKHERGTNSFLEFLTCAIVVGGKRFTIDVVPISPFGTLEELMDESLRRVKKKIHIDKVLLDRGFDRAKIINILKKHNLKFIMPKVRSSTVKAWFDKSEDCKARIIKNFKIGEATSNLIIVDDQEGIKRAFITNIDIPVQLTHYFYKWYGKRWGIETSYRNMDQDFKPRTTTKNYIIRLFYFLFSVCLYNLWVLVNICISLALYGRIKEKPIITAKLFTILLYKVYIDSGG